MDKNLSEEEKIKRAEEISARRYNRIPANSINSMPKKKLSYFSKIFIQVICSICIFGIFYFINQNNSYAIEKIRPILSEDTDFAQIYNQIDGFFKNVTSSFNKNDIEKNDQNDETNKEANSIEDNTVSENAIVEVNNDENNNIAEEDSSENGDNNESNNEANNNQENETPGIGGGDEVADISETDQDVLYIKANASFIKPVNGYITSGYGEREATEIISANHAGVDIGANTGTEIIASMSGTVELVSNYGDYGNHLKITNGEITTLYAHCSNIFVKQGEYVNQGQKIAEVGSTGRTTGPHLHFEIRRNNKTVDPQKIVDL